MKRLQPLLAVAFTAVSLLPTGLPALAQSGQQLPDVHDTRAFRGISAPNAARQNGAAPRLLGYTWYSAQNATLAPVDSFSLEYASASSRQVHALNGFRYLEDAWHRYDRYVYYYDAAGNNLRTDYEIWSKNGDSFQKLVRYSYTLNAAGAATDLLYQIWDNNAGSYVNGISEHYTLNGRNQVLTLLQRFWDKKISDWYDYMHVTNTYSSYGQMLEQTMQYWNANLSLWENKKRFAWAFSASSGHADADTSYVWDNIANDWLETERNRYTLNAARQPGIATKENYQPGKTGWAPLSQSSFKYDPSGKLSSETLQAWDAHGVAFVNSTNTLHSYNKSGQPLVESTLIWDGTGWGIGDNANRTMYYYESALGLPGMNEAKTAVAAWPLPAHSTLHLSAPAGGIDFSRATISLTDMRGSSVKCVSSEATQERLSLSVESLPAGIYLLRVRDGQGRQASLTVPVVH